MKIVIAMDSFKGSLSSLAAGETVASALRENFPQDRVQVFPLADGGEGTVDALTQGLGGRIVPVTVTGPLGTPVASRYGYLESTHTAIIEMADAAGLPLVPENQRNPLNTTTYGLGELILAAKQNGARHFLIGIGGSATNDCGLGMLAALGVKFRWKDSPTRNSEANAQSSAASPSGGGAERGEAEGAPATNHRTPAVTSAPTPASAASPSGGGAERGEAEGAPATSQTKCIPFGRDLAGIVSIDVSALKENLAGCTFAIACDVTNPLCGENGCSAIFGPQKGATPEIVKKMDCDIHAFAQLAEKTLAATTRRNSLADAENRPGAGAAGGLGFAFSVFLGGTLTPGTTLILKNIGIERALKTADLLITGEGRMDAQTAMGKAPAGVAQLAKRARPACKTVALCGCATKGAEAVNQSGIDAYFPILHRAVPVETAMQEKETKSNLARTIVQVRRLLM